ncbi:hypothetical protein LTR95_006385 [Oleoguttula sp. CCFEE 5521]
MDQRPPSRPYDRPPGEQHQMLYQHQAPPYSTHTAQPPSQIPFSDPFPRTRDPFLPPSHGRSESNGFGGRAWAPSMNGNGIATHASPPQDPSQQTRLPPPPYALDQSHVPMSFDPSRRRSLGGIGSPPARHEGAADLHAHHMKATNNGFADLRDPHTMPTTFSSRNMPPPSSPQIPPYSSNPTMPGTAPRGPPTASPFAGIRDLASMSSHHRSNGGMSISAILEDTRKPDSSPHLSNAFASQSQNLMRPPSPGRARASSMREGYARQMRPMSPGRINAFSEQRPASAVLDQERFAPEAMRDGMFRSPHLPRESAHSFRAFRAPPERSPNSNGVRAPMRPSSQPIEPGPTRPLDEILKRDDAVGGRLGVFRAFGDSIHKPRSEAPGSHDGPPPPRQNGAPTSQPTNGMVSRSPQSAREEHSQRLQQTEPQPGLFGRPMREDHAGLFRPTYQPQQPNALEQARESIEARVQYEPRPDHPHSSPPMSDIGMFGPPRNGYYERPLTYEEHQQMEATRSREMEQRKSSDGAMHRALMNISPELSRRGRNSPLPQAVQGAQPRPSGAGIKSEFGRMFSGLGSGVGSATPVAGQSANGMTTPSRQSPMAQADEVDLMMGDRQDGRSTSKLARAAKANGRRSREESRMLDSEGFDGRMTPSLSQRGNKRSKTSHHHHHHGHHHHHHHHDAVEVQATAVNPTRFASEAIPHSSATPIPAHHHHHHHGAHAHPGHHHHHAAKTVPLPRKPTTTIESQQIIDSVATKPRKHLGSHLYEAEVSDFHPHSPSSSHLPYTNTMIPIPKFTERENCTLTVRVPRWYLTRSPTEIEANEPSRLEIISRRRQLWGSDVYTDDSDVVAAAIHSGWLRGDFGDLAGDLIELCGSDDEGAAPSTADAPLSYPSKPAHPIFPPTGYDAHITILVLPALKTYTGTSQHHLRSRTWKGTPHDGMSYVVLGLEFVDEGPAGRDFRRGNKARKERLRLEAERREEAAMTMSVLSGRA